MILLVDVYTKLIIAVLGFIAPTVTLLLPLLGRRIEILKRQLVIQEMQMQIIQQNAQSQYEQQFSSITDEGLKTQLQKTAEKYAKGKTKEFDKAVRKLKRQITFLDLKTLIQKIFGALIVSLFFVMAYHLVKVNLYNCFGLEKCYHLPLSLFLLFVSGLFFAYSLIILWEIVCIIVDDSGDKSDFILNNDENLRQLDADEIIPST